MEVISTFTITVFFILWTFLAAFLIYSLFFQTPFYPSRTKSVEEAFKAFNITLNSKTKFVDLGSGVGTVVKWAADKGAQADGLELNPFLSLLSRLRLIGRKNAKIYNKNFFKADLSSYSIVYMYIYREFADKLKEKLFSELNDDAVVILNTFPFTNEKYDDKFQNMYLYKVKNAKSLKKNK